MAYQCVVDEERHAEDQAGFATWEHSPPLRLHPVANTEQSMSQRRITEFLPSARHRIILIALAAFSLVIWLLFGYSTIICSWPRERVRQSMSVVTPISSDSGRGQHRRGIIQVSQLDKSLLPGKKPHGQQSRRLVIIGDVHGCKHELLALLDKVDFDRTRDHLIFTGDLIAKGPSSRGVVELARSLNASSVRGNHEDLLLNVRAGIPPTDSGALSAVDLTLKNQRKADAMAVISNDLSKEDIEWLAQCPAILSLGHIPGLPYGNVVVVHAGLVPHVPLQKQDVYQVMNMRSINPKTLLPSEGRDAGAPWWKVWNREQKQSSKEDRTLVVYGHDSKTGLKEKRSTIGLDSGCVSGGRLSALVMQGDGSETTMHIKSVSCKDYI